MRFVMALMLGLGTLAFAGTDLNGFQGKVHLTAAKSPYLVNHSMVLSVNDTLIVDPGVEIRIMGYHKLMLRGCVRIKGTAKKPVKIIADDSSASWVGLHFSTGANDVSIEGLEVRNAFRNTFSGVKGKIQKSLFEGNFYAMWVEESPNLSFLDCAVTHNRYGITVGSDSITVSRSRIQANAIGIWLEGAGKIHQESNSVSLNTEQDLSTPKDPSRQGLVSKFTRRALQAVESSF